MQSTGQSPCFVWGLVVNPSDFDIYDDIRRSVRRRGLSGSRKLCQGSRQIIPRIRFAFDCPAEIVGEEARVGLCQFPMADVGGVDERHPSVMVASQIGYFENNASRMKYPEYRVQGLSITPAHMESCAKYCT